MPHSPRVLNRHRDFIPADAIYIGRGSPYGNPYVMGKDGDRDEVVRMYEEYVERYPEFRQLIADALRGKDLVCFCAPKPCHGDVLIRIANVDLSDERNEGDSRNE